MYTLMSNIMARFLTITETRKQLLELPDQLADEPVMLAAIRSGLGSCRQWQKLMINPI